MRWISGALLVTALALPASAQAEPMLTVELERQSVRYGGAHQVDGTLTDGTALLAGQEVILEGRRYPYEGSYRVIERSRTDADGEFRFSAELDRNHRLRVVAPAQQVQSERLQAYTLPGFELSFRAISPGVVRLYQRYTVPKPVRLSSPTLFYLGRRGAERASLRRTGNVRRVRAGRYTSQVTVTLPSSWNGAFRYASCFRASAGSGMGDPEQSCPRLRLEF
ncbi:hypothetical protein DVA67_027145 [Solirubrobacter sp. CPCC 204708]|uniref:Carboxypeptidase regulatory-like domain-containing protein n=1 Tax=Solirubrobacter deserti TaxID=2282478 RepID=A0ABT4RGT6_9ACTN|nr:hypothetical protein [Solirubrobacter deserti]MBE2319675.1 hypothetical protein [Solirubrobacter deserti]MDA0137586.1 hypothetical protein [Solirubrobacter deserti]